MHAVGHDGQWQQLLPRARLAGLFHSPAADNSRTVADVAHMSCKRTRNVLMQNFGAFLHADPVLPRSVAGDVAPIAMEGMPIEVFAPPDDMKDWTANAGDER